MLIDESKIINEEYCNEELALAYLLVSGYVFLNTVDISKSHPEFYKEPKWTTCIYVNCSDTFYYSSADAECISNDDGGPDSEIIHLYKYVKENPRYGVVKYCALKRKMPPLSEIIQWMKDDNYWDADMEALL